MTQLTAEDMETSPVKEASQAILTLCDVVYLSTAEHHGVIFKWCWNRASGYKIVRIIIRIIILFNLQIQWNYNYLIVNLNITILCIS